MVRGGRGPYAQGPTFSLDPVQRCSFPGSMLARLQVRCRAGEARYPANDTRLHVAPPSLVIHRAPSVASATPCWPVSNPTSENPPDGPARATVQAPPEETRTLPSHEKRLPVIAVTPSDQAGGAVMAVQLDPPSVETYARSYWADWPSTSQTSTRLPSVEAPSSAYGTGSEVGHGTAWCRPARVPVYTSTEGGMGPAPSWPTT